MAFKESIINFVKKLWNKIYFWTIDFSYLSRQECLDILDTETNMFSQADNFPLFDKELSRSNLKIEFYNKVLDDLMGQYRINWDSNGRINWEIKGIGKRKFYKIIRHQNKMILEAKKIIERLGVLEEVELCGISEEDSFLIRKKPIFHMTEKELEMAKGYEYFRLRKNLGHIYGKSPKVVLSFEERE